MALAVACLVALSGCRLGAEVDIQVAADGSGRVVVRLAADAELVARAPGLLDDLRLDDVRATGWTVTGPQGDGAGGLTLVVEHAFADPAEANRLLAALDGDGGPFQALHLDVVPSFATRTTTLTGTLHLAGPGAFTDAPLLAALGTTAPFGGQVADPGAQLDVGLVLRAAGEVRGTNGAPVDGGVRWAASPIADRTVPVQATVALVDRDAMAARDRARLARLGLVAWAVVVVLIGTAVVLRRRAVRRRRPARAG